MRTAGQGACVAKGRSAGFSLVEVLVAMAIAGLLAVGLSKTLDSGFRSARKLQDKGEFESIRMQIRESVSCQRTMAGLGSPASCTTLDLKTQSNRVIGLATTFQGAPVRKVGNWLVQSSCGATSLVVKLARPNSALSDFAKDPVLQTPMDFNVPSHALFGDAPSQPKLCDEYFVPATPTPTATPAIAGVPTGAVMAFNLASCPTGWIDYVGARGRMVVGAASAGAGSQPQTYGSLPVNGIYGGPYFTLGIANIPPHSHQVRLVQSNGGELQNYPVDFNWAMKDNLEYQVHIWPGGNTRPWSQLNCNYSTSSECLLVANGDGLGPYAHATGSIRPATGDVNAVVVPAGANPNPIPIAPPMVALLYCQKS